MIFRLPCLLLLAIGFAAPVGAASSTLPLQHGEHLTYRVSWAIVPGAGEIKIDATADSRAPQPVLKVTTTTATRGFARVLMRFDASGESVFDLNTGKLRSLSETSLHRGKKATHSVAFDHVTRVATYTDPDAAAPRMLPIPPGDPVDLIMGLLQTRTWDLKVGEKRDALVLFDDDFYELTIHAVRVENVRTSLGTFSTLVLEPRMEKTPPKGMFRRGSTVRVWISQDSRKVPVKFEVEFKIGTGTATLTAYTPPDAPAGLAKAPAPPASASPDEKNPRP